MRNLIAKYAASSPRPLNLSNLLSFGRPLTHKSVLDSVSYVLAEIPGRLATRLQYFESLPFIVATNPYVATVMETHRSSLKWLISYPPPKNTEENALFAKQLEQIVQSHVNDIPTMAKGFQECSKYMSPTQITNFLDGTIRNRISVRLIAEQHLALSNAIASNKPSREVGVVDMHCSPANMISMCGSFVAELCEATLGSSPTITINGQTRSTFAYVPVHLEYILTELLKNSFRATVEHHKGSSQPIPSVVVTLSPPGPKSNPKGSFFSIRIRDQGGGVSPSNMARIFSYAFTTAGRDAVRDESEGGPYAAQQIGGSAAVGGGDGLFGEITGKGLQTGLGTIAGLGYGLPMSRLYATYFGGSLELMSLEGWGSDVFLKLRCLDEAQDAAI